MRSLLRKLLRIVLPKVVLTSRVCFNNGLYGFRLTDRYKLGLFCGDGLKLVQVVIVSDKKLKMWVTYGPPGTNILFI